MSCSGCGAATLCLRASYPVVLSLQGPSCHQLVSQCLGPEPVSHKQLLLCVPGTPLSTLPPHILSLSLQVLITSPQTIILPACQPSRGPDLPPRAHLCSCLWRLPIAWTETKLSCPRPDFSCSLGLECPFYFLLSPFSYQPQLKSCPISSLA